jgi:DNA invertase Pin-like site-specific DNA recombinase
MPKQKKAIPRRWLFRLKSSLRFTRRGDNYIDNFRHLHLQQDALRAAGCEKIFLDEVSGTVASRPGLDKLKEQ